MINSLKLAHDIFLINRSHEDDDVYSCKYMVNCTCRLIPLKGIDKLRAVSEQGTRRAKYRFKMTNATQENWKQDVGLTFHKEHRGDCVYPVKLQRFGQLWGRDIQVW